ncbi:Peptide methionine sulfoxide reductase MsrA [Pragia fontium]|uniref:Peptide methionine sulfoxide reductase MsrA n=1 Tax=Pragia fontium TaxID=82985 RepID=A0ABQ5LK38_9GAMM|nr:peptide-methionine (S)-S-oxide reductase MsrA [Pragia fontium]GKX63217.1 peptide methionine sulfoxide reductase MsrA [Pragia fontium]SUB81241.1 Peptide methionine sulfoxide reductase MsrA [Pragia fontium]
MLPFNILEFISPEKTLPGRDEAMKVAPEHLVLHSSMTSIPPNMATAIFAMGCFWGVERLFWQQSGIFSTAVGYSGGFTPNPTYREVCSGQTGHAEAVKVVFDPTLISYPSLLKLFWENHDPAQGMRQGNDIGSQYRSAIYATTPEQLQQALDSKADFEAAMTNANDKRPVTTEIALAKPFYFAEDEHQQYLAKHPNGYCNLGGIGICLPPKN